MENQNVTEASLDEAPNFLASKTELLPHPHPKSNIPQSLNPGTWEMLDSENTNVARSLEPVWHEDITRKLRGR